MVNRAWIAVVAAPLVLVVGTAMAATSSGALSPSGGDVVCARTGPTASIAAGQITLTPEQSGNATTIRDVGAAMAVPPRGQAIAIATAMVESGLRNLDHGDADSLGLFQQRPSAGWGTREQIMDPVYASRKFYEALQNIPGWQSLPFGDAAQAVQRSAFPDRYQKWEATATAIVDALAGTESFCAVTDTDTPLPEDVAGNLPADYTLPAGTPTAVVTAITWALRQLGTSYYYGGSCTDPHGSDVTKHCDCSSLVQQAYRAAGIALSRTTYTQIKEGIRVASPADLKPGDLIFLPGHVGIYLGNDLVVHAPHTGDFVRVAQLRPYWVNRWAGARRVA